ncbi:cytidylyltransferase domain-containing protein [Natroniella sp. ANB-PHB2]|uniref:cytidylyltransferase domain-containing protein n=1 Tax=Natroniella sp. ANB-PHB2 TaxID=3384444 RepID=UPI0038D47BD7
MNNNERVVAIVQARMGSSRLPGKVAKELIDKPMLAHTIDRLKAAKELDKIVLATSIKEADDKVVEIAESEGVDHYRGSEADVLSRYIGAAKEYNADIVVRITGDCPLVDPVTIDEVVSEFQSSDLDYMRLKGYPRGFGTEVCSVDTLLKVEQAVNDDIKDNPYREHVTLYIYRHPEKFKIGIKEASSEFNRDYRLCVDEEDDFTLIKEIYKRLYQEGEIINIRNVIKLLDENPNLAKINTHVEQKKV